MISRFCLFGCLMFAVLAATPTAASEADWLGWRGPHQNGVSDEKDLPGSWTPGGAGQLWEVALMGRGTPVIRGERVYVLGYQGEGQMMREVLRCLDAATGKTVWEQGFSDFLSDIIYSRYSIGAPVIDGDTGNVYVQTSAGMLAAFTADGKALWHRSLMEELGRMTFPNGRTGPPSIHRDLVIVHCMTSNWGAHGPVQDRFYAYDKRTGDQIWSSSPGIRPKDNSMGTPVFGKLGKREVFFSGTGCGNVVAIDANTGEPQWRFPLSYGGINSSVLLLGDDRLVAIHAKENVDTSESGRLVAIDLKVKAGPADIEVSQTPILPRSAEVWRNPGLAAWSSSPIVVGDRIYLTTETAELVAVDAKTGKQLWHEKFGIDQLHSSIAYGDGKLYVPIKDGTFLIVRPTDTKAEVLSSVKLAGENNGAPAIAHGRVYIHSTEKLYCFGTVRASPTPAPVATLPKSTAAPVKLQPIPAEVILRTGENRAVKMGAVDADGLPVDYHASAPVTWEKFIPPTARIQSLLDASWTDPGTIIAEVKPRPSAGMFKATAGNLTGYLRGRILNNLPIKEDFSQYELSDTHMFDKKPVKFDHVFAYPPLPWIGARLKWEVTEVDGNKVFTKTIDNRLFQRATVFIGLADQSDYTIQADMKTDGNRRKMSEVGLINQRYMIILKGNAQELEINSNLERIRASVPFTVTPGVWYRMTARVDLNPDGSGVVRAKAWKRDEAEPAAWTIETTHQVAHRQGSPGLFGFSPTEQRVYLDNISVTPNASAKKAP